MTKTYTLSIDESGIQLDRPGSVPLQAIFSEVPADDYELLIDQFLKALKTVLRDDYEDIIIEDKDSEYDE